MVLANEISSEPNEKTATPTDDNSPSVILDRIRLQRPRRMKIEDMLAAIDNWEANLASMRAADKAKE